MSRVPVIFNNTSCLKCDETKGEMIRWGVMVFCNNCFPGLFPGVDWKTVDWSMFDQKRFDKKYHDWLNVYKEKYT